MKKRVDWFNIVLILVIIAAIVLLILQNTLFNASLSISDVSPKTFSITGHATETSTTSNVTIQKYLSIAKCVNLTDGIRFGNVATLPTSNVNASHNYDGVSDGSSLCINVSTDSNTAIDLCTKADQNLTSVDSDLIILDNETYANFTTTNATAPFLADEISLTTTYVKSGDAITAGGLNYYRFWLDVPAAQPSGDYNNTVSFKGVTTTLACGA